MNQAVDGDERNQQRPGLRPAFGVAIVLGLMAVVLALGWVLRPTVPRASESAASGAAPATQDAAPAPGSAGQSLAATMPTVAGEATRATTTPTVQGAGSVSTATTQPSETTAFDRTPRPLAVGTVQVPPGPTEDVAQLTATADTGATGTAPPAADGDANSTSALGETYTGLPVALPTTAVLGGAEVPVGPASVRTDGARAFAQTLLGRARTQDAGLLEEPGLRQLAEQALVNELTRSTPRGMVLPTRLRQGSVTVQIDVVATLPDATGATLRAFSMGRVPAIGVAVGVAGRVEPDYLPDLVAVAAVAYR